MCMCVYGRDSIAVTGYERENFGAIHNLLLCEIMGSDLGPSVSLSEAMMPPSGLL